ncbi:anthranilate phosphoribosyltransferase [Corynebacterium pygosceleis]|uniref:Anthranilate phosphoribosyltransferase n=1 Tax=Corynebacterium pygosceleis TaxID=2800406 RepID=A0A9Q4GLL5_9CORY|nr:anthranilate phosphoribosyltransferase [Corynebacterium pygosceleis]MCK7637187.1 anthranilate phosphoribosyltransferase [Corynebacterium pygosceleis]MCL0120038.1 anthranilate phosphoribosyltransferase [Corynebacterium pygosceleis]MCX7445090.1 anthranilate phosphoribosyltransferase [Corynebacterium pygosceleis]MCX7468485.1 anthranilate phosphoribosyltransferase [Corynebacterium pygosceleis]
MTHTDPHTLLTAYLDNGNPTVEEARAVFNPLTTGSYSTVQVAALLATLRTRGETASDIAGAAQAFINAARPFPVEGEGVTDSCGTGGDGANTINISTAAALVAAAGGVTMVKHGNRSVSSRSGSADVLEALNIPLDLDPTRAERQVRASNFTFLFAPAYHPAIAHVMPVRKELKVPTIFNILGPLLNPAKPHLQLMGIARPELGPAIIEVMRELGRTRALVVHGSGTDEIAVHGPTTVWELRDGSVTDYELTPEDLGVGTHSLDDLAGGNGAENAEHIRATFAGTGPDAHLDAIAVNAGALFYLNGDCDTIAAGATKAKQLLADKTVETWLATHEEADYA